MSKEAYRNIENRVKQVIIKYAELCDQAVNLKVDDDLFGLGMSSSVSVTVTLVNKLNTIIKQNLRNS
jgi:mevalonate kinase